VNIAAVEFWLWTDWIEFWQAKGKKPLDGYRLQTALLFVGNLLKGRAGWGGGGGGEQWTGGLLIRSFFN
jgi:hypothetical protein